MISQPMAGKTNKQILEQRDKAIEVLKDMGYEEANNMHETNKRKSIPKSTRIQVYNKYSGHCAYCGCELDYKDMQVDHINPLYWHNGDNDIDNYNPACRMCNFYKSTYTIEKFRERIQTLHYRLEGSFIYRLAKRYGIIQENTFQIKFYFEKEEEAVVKE